MTRRRFTRLGFASAALVALLAVGLAVVPAGADGNEAPANPAAFRGITAGAHHSCALVGRGTVECWGDNAFGQLGQGDTADRGDGAREMGSSLPPVNLGVGRTATSVVAGGEHTCALLDNGTVKCWGANTHGQLGLGDTAARGDGPNEMGANLPAVALGSGRTVTAVSAGGDHTCALLNANALKCWGFNDSGQLGLGNKSRRGDGPNEMGDNLPTVALGSGATAVTAGATHTCALLSSGGMKCWGENGAGQLGIGDTTDRGDGPNEMGGYLPTVRLGTGNSPTAATAAGSHTCALLANGTAKCWGGNTSGQLGLGDLAGRGDGANEMGTNLPTVALGSGRTVAAVTTGGSHTCARLDDATVKCWGGNGAGELGLGDTANRGDAANEMGDSLPVVDLYDAPSASMRVIATSTETRVGTGDTVHLSLNVANTGNTILHDVTIAEPDAPGCGAAPFTLAVGAETTVRCTHPATAGDVPTYTHAASVVSTEVMTPVTSNQVHVAVRALSGVRSIAAGTHSCALLAGGRVKCWGPNQVGQLGLGDTADRGDGPGEMGRRLRVVDLGVGRSAVSLAVGTAFTCALLDDGTVKCWGKNDVGQLGLGDTQNRGDGTDEMGHAAQEMGDHLPAVDLGAGRTAIAIAAGEAHACALLDDGTVKCWGGNDYGQLGLGNLETRGDGPGEMGDNLPTVPLGSRRTAVAVSAGDSHTCALLDDATLKCWGASGAGALGLGDSGNNRGDGPNEMGDGLQTVNLGIGRSAVAVAAGHLHTCALLDDATVKCWGYAQYGQVGLGERWTYRGSALGQMGDNLPPVDLGSGRTAIAITASFRHTCALLDSGATKCWGENDSGQAGTGDTSERGNDPGEMGDNLPAVDLGNARTATAIAAGTRHSCALLDNGTVKCWGYNSQGQLGLGDTLARGNGPGEMGDNLPAVDLGAGPPSVRVVATANETRVVTGETMHLHVNVANTGGEPLHNVTITDAAAPGCAAAPFTLEPDAERTVDCTRAATAGDLPTFTNSARVDSDETTPTDSNPVTVAVATPTAVRSTAVGEWHSCALLVGGRVKCWGRNTSGQAGLGRFTNSGDAAGEMGGHLAIVDLGTNRTATALAAGTFHTCALLDDGSVKCWGRGNEGQLGLGSRVWHGRDASEGGMGDDLPAVDLGTGRTATAIAAGDFYSCALLDDGTVKCWGYNANGQLGIGDLVTHGDGPGEMGDNLPTVDLGAGRTAVSITAGAAHTCARLDDGTVKCWGFNGVGPLGLGDTGQRGDGPGEMGDNLPAVDVGTGRIAVDVTAGSFHTCALLDNGTVRCWGWNVEGQLGLGDTTQRGDGPGEMGDNLAAVDVGTGRTVAAVRAGGTHTCAVLDNGSVKCWGFNGDGALGLGDTAARGDGPAEMGDNLPAVDLGTGRTAVAVTPRDHHTCALLDDAAVKCWGHDDSGQLGQGDTVDRGDGPGEMGDALPPVLLEGDPPTPSLSVVKSADEVSVSPGQAIHYHLVISNTGNVELHDVDVTDVAAPDCDEDTLFDLPAGDFVTIDCAYITSGNDVGTYANTASVASFDTAAVLSNTVTVTVRPAVSVDKTADESRVAAGETIHYHLQVTNRSAFTLSGLELADANAPACAGSLPDLAAGADTTVDCAYATTDGDVGTYHNTATVDSASIVAADSNRLDVVVQPAPLAATSVTSGSNHSCALLVGGAVKCWGDNASGQLGLGDTADRGDAAGGMGGHLPAVSLGTGLTATAIAAGGNHTCALLDDGTVKCWGENSFGRLGVGDTADRGDGPGEMGDSLPAVDLGSGRTAVAISAGAYHTCALLDDGTLKCWGYNAYGQLGQGDQSARGDGPGELGANLPAVDLGAGRTAVGIDAGSYHSCVVLDNATVKCWGRNDAGQLGLANTVNRGDDPSEMGGQLPAVVLGGYTARAVSAGGDHTCALLTTWDVKCWGDNASGELGLGDTDNRGDVSGEMGNSLPLVALGTGRTATSVSAGSSHTCAVLDDATLKCWGSNGSGRLGLGDTAARGDGAGEMGDNLPVVALGTGRTVTVASAGGAHTCARLDDAAVKCWGENGSGQLGQGDTADRGDGSGEMGDSLVRVGLGKVPGPTGVSGTVTESGSGAPVAGAMVAVLRAADFSMAAGGVANRSGDYSVAVPAGSYFVYVIDPAAGHAAGFFGPPTTVAVTAGSMVQCDPTLVSSKGTIAGAVTDSGSAAPIPGAWVIGINAATGATARGAVANGSGQYRLEGLAPGSYRPVYIDPTGAHASRYSPNSVDFLGATSLTVNANATTAANVGLPSQSTTPGATTLSGTIRETGSNRALAGVFVVALRASDFRNAAGTVTNASGEYAMNVAAGDYKIAFIDSDGRHLMEWHDNQPASGLATATSVTAPSVTDASLDPTTGSMAGTIVDDPSSAPVSGAWVLAIDPTGSVSGAVADSSGAYTLPGLTPGTYRAAFIDPSGGRNLEYYDNSATYGGATSFSITAANTITIDAALAAPAVAPPTFADAWGSDGNGDGQFAYPAGIAVDSSGNVLVVDEDNNRVEKFTSTGSYLAQWGGTGSGSGEFNNPIGIAIDAADNVYVTDAGNNRVQKFTSSGTYLAQWGAAGAGNGQFNGPLSVAADPFGNVYVSDSGNSRVQKFTSAGAYLAQWGGIGGGHGEFDGVTAVATDRSGNVYVADVRRIQKFTATGTFLTQWVGTGNGQFPLVADMAVDPGGTVYISDFVNDRMQAFTSNGTYLMEWGSSGVGDGQFDHPWGIAVAPTGDLYVTDTLNHRVQRFTRP